MISSGQNSALSNSCFEVKRARMERYASGTGNVESLKMEKHSHSYIINKDVNEYMVKE